LPSRSQDRARSSGGVDPALAGTTTGKTLLRVSRAL